MIEENPRKPGCLTDIKHGRPLVSFFLFLCFEMAHFPTQLIDSVHSALLVMDCIKQLLRSLAVHCRMTSMLFINQRITALVSNKNVPAGINADAPLMRIYRLSHCCPHFK